MLNTQQVGAQDDFFELGGHSLLVTKLVALLRARIGQDVSMKTIFTERTVRNIAMTLSETSLVTASVDRVVGEGVECGVSAKEAATTCKSGLTQTQASGLTTVQEQMRVQLGLTPAQMQEIVGSIAPQDAPEFTPSVEDTASELITKADKVITRSEDVIELLLQEQMDDEYPEEENVTLLLSSR